MQSEGGFSNDRVPMAHNTQVGGDYQSGGFQSANVPVPAVEQEVLSPAAGALWAYNPNLRGPGPSLRTTGLTIAPIVVHDRSQRLQHVEIPGSAPASLSRDRTPRILNAYGKHEKVTALRYDAPAAQWVISPRPVYNLPSVPKGHRDARTRMRPTKSLPSLVTSVYVHQPSSIYKATSGDGPSPALRPH